MKIVTCHSVRLQSLTEISPKCYLAKCWNGSEAFVPKSVVFGQDWEVQKSEAWWIAAWFLVKEDVHIQYSSKKERRFNKETGAMLPEITYIRHIPEKHIPVKIEPHVDLNR